MPDSQGGQTREDLVKSLIELWDYYRGILEPKVFKAMADDHKLFLGYRQDKRKANEQWRSWSMLGDPFRLTRIETDAWLEIMNSMDPPLQCEGRGSEDEGKARAYERAGEFILNANRWTQSQESLFRNLSVRGWQPIKTGWKELKFSPISRPTDAQRREFDTRLNEAMKTGAVKESPPTDSQDLQQWQDWHAKQSVLYPNLPSLSLAMPQPRETVLYRGPWYDYPSPFTLAFDPFCEDLATMETPFFQRFVKPRKFAEDKIKKGEFDEEAVKQAGKGGDKDRLTQWDQQIATEIGLSYSADDPIYKNSDEYLEVWRPFEPQDQYLVIMNRSQIVNVNTGHPFWHRQLPYFFIRNIPITGHPFGLSSYHQLRRTFEDRCLFRDLLLDMLVLHGLGVYLKKRTLGMTDAQRILTPGMIFDSNDPEGFRSALGPITGFSELMQIGQTLLGDQTSLTSTGENVAGQPATVGRVSATEATARMTQALVPHKKKAERLEEELSATLGQMFYNIYQKMGPEHADLDALRQNMIGQDEQDPFADPTLTRETFGEALSMDIRFRGATTKLNKELLAQQLLQFLQTVSQMQSASGTPVQLFTPIELRTITRKVFETYGQKGIAEILTPEGDQIVQQLAQAHAISAQTAPVAAQTGLVQARQGLEQLQNPPAQPEQPAPNVDPQYKYLPPDVQRQAEQKAGYQPSQMGGVPPDQGTPPEQMPPQEAPVAQ